MCLEEIQTTSSSLLLESFEATTLLNVYPVVKSYYPLTEDSSTALFLDPMLIQAIETVKKCPEYLPFVVNALLDLNILPTDWSLMPSQ